MSSVRTEAGSSTSTFAALELGRQLAEQFDETDTVRKWMAYHLAELIALAEDDSATTVEQRQQIVELILKVWAHRRYCSGSGLLDGYPAVFAALERLGDDTPSKLFRAFDQDEPLDSGETNLPVLRNALELARLAHESVVALLWLAAKDASQKNAVLLELADSISLTFESRVTRRLSQLRRRTASTGWTPNDGNENADAEEAVFAASEGADVVDDQMIRRDLAARLRLAAGELRRIADEVAPDEVPSPGQH